MNNLTNVCSSASSNSVTVDFWKLKDDSIIQGKVFAVFLLFCELLGLPWNILVVITIIKEKLYHQPTIILLMNLLAADFFILAYPSPILMTTGFAGEFIIGSSDRVRCATCQLGFALLVPFYNSFFTVALMSLDRFLYIYKPLQYERSSTKHIALVAVIVAVLVSISIGLGSHLDPNKIDFNSSLLNCIERISDSIWYPIILVVIGVVVLVVIIISNVWFSYIVLKNIRAVYSCEDTTDEAKGRSKWSSLMMYMKTPRYRKQIHLYRMFFTLLFSSVIVWVPFIYDLGTFIMPQPSPHSLELSTVGQLLLYSQVVLHPILETVLIDDIRMPLKDMVTCGHFKKKRNELSIKENECNCCHPHINKEGRCCSLVTLIEAALLPQNLSTDKR